MPTYELPLLLRVMSKPKTVETLKRTAQAIFSKGGFIRKIEHLGQQEMPCKTTMHGQVFREANYFIFYFDSPPKHIDYLIDEYNRDMDIIRNRIYKQNEPEQVECTFHDEMLPPAYRPEVQKLIELAGKQKTKKKFRYNSGLDYYPFQK